MYCILNITKYQTNKNVHATPRLYSMHSTEVLSFMHVASHEAQIGRRSLPPPHDWPYMTSQPWQCVSRGFQAAKREIRPIDLRYPLRVLSAMFTPAFFNCFQFMTGLGGRLVYSNFNQSLLPRFQLHLWTTVLSAGRFWPHFFLREVSEHTRHLLPEPSTLCSRLNIIVCVQQPLVETSLS